MGKGGCTAAGRAARSKAQGQPDLNEGCVRRDDAYKVFILIWFLQANRRKSRCRDYGLDKQLFVQTAPPPQRGRGRGCGAERRQWRMQRGGAPVAVEKIEQASSAKIFSGTARRWGQMRPRLPLERICAQYGFGFFDREKSKSVASTAKRQRGLQRGKPGSPLPCFASFCRSKRKAPAASGAN